MKDILDYEEKPKTSRKPRYFAYLLEGIPIVFSLLFLLTDRKQVFFMVTMVLSLIYIFFGWYLFKTAKHKWYNILIATIAGLLLASVLMGPIFHVMNWEGGTEMLIAGTVTLIYGTIATFVIAVIRSFISEDKGKEWGMSWKIFSRFLIFSLIYYFTDMADVFLDLLDNAE